jgi:elongation factor G
MEIHNLALVGQAGAGKTLLTEALLLEAGAIRAKGSLARGNTVSDFDPKERVLQHSLDAAICTFDDGDQRINLVDTPGLADLIGRSLSALEATETAGVVVSAAAGVDPVTRRAMDAARERGLSRFVIVNKIDSPGAKCEEVLSQLREAFGKECLPLNLPAEGGSRVIDCFFQGQGAKTDFSSVEEVHAQLVDQVVELDEVLMADYLEHGEVATERLHATFEKALREGHLVPVCFVSAETGAGVRELLNVIERLMPTPAEAATPPFFERSNGDLAKFSVRPDPDAHLVAHVFKVSIDPFVGKFGILRVHQGTLRPGSQLFVGDARKPVKVAHLYRLLGKEHVQTQCALPGDICAVAKVDELSQGAVLHDSHDEDHLHFEAVAYPPPMVGVAIEPEQRGGEQRLSDAMHKVLAEDPCVRIERHAALHETVLYGMGELHLRVLLERMTERFGAHVKTHPPSIPYRETITRKAEGHSRHKKQTGGAGQFGEVFLRVEALERGKGFEFVDEVVGGAIPFQFIPAVEKGVRQVLMEGALAGYPIEDVRVTVYDGKHHPVDSKEVAFVAAGRKAFLDAIGKASPIVLEPIMRMDVTAPSASLGDVIGDLSAKRARIGGNSTLPGSVVSINALVPLAELDGYPSRLKSLTGGEGSFTMALSHYDPVLARRQEELVHAYKPRAEQD